MYSEHWSTQEFGLRANDRLVYSACFRLADINQIFLHLVAKDASLGALHWHPLRL